MKITRREFLKVAGPTIVGTIAVYTTAPRVLAAVLGAEGVDEKAEGATGGKEHAWAFAVDIGKCIGCNKCLEACKLENHVPPDVAYNRTWVERYRIGEDGAVRVDAVGWGVTGPEPLSQGAGANSTATDKSFFVPKLCNQCANPPCVRVCPVSATFKTRDGVILVDEKRCIGCKYCITACPYGARFLNPETKVADKCTWCYQRISKGLRPACVEVCPVGARVFGDLNDPESPVRKLIAEEMTQVLKPELGTKPQVYYAGMQKGVR